MLPPAGHGNPAGNRKSTYCALTGFNRDATEFALLTPFSESCRRSVGDRPRQCSWRRHSLGPGIARPGGAAAACGAAVPEHVPCATAHRPRAPAWRAAPPPAAPRPHAPAGKMLRPRRAPPSAGATALRGLHRRPRQPAAREAAPIAADHRTQHAAAAAAPPGRRGRSDDVGDGRVRAPRARRRLPDGSVFGTATAARQTEGGSAAGGRAPSIRGDFSGAQGNVVGGGGGGGGFACDRRRLFEEDVARGARGGAPADRPSVAWPRVLPGCAASLGVSTGRARAVEASLGTKTGPRRPRRS